MENKKSIGLPGGPNEFLKEITQHISVEGYKRYSKDINNPYNIIESGNITMEDVDFPVYGRDNLGNEQIMMPGMNYQFPGDSVLEVPMAQYGIETGDFRNLDPRLSSAYNSTDATSVNVDVANPNIVNRSTAQRIQDESTPQTVSTYVEPSTPEKVLNRLANPFTTAGYVVRGQQIPDRVGSKENVFDMAADIVNPAAYIDYGTQAFKDYGEGNVVGGTLNAMGALPFIPGSADDLLRTGKIGQFVDEAGSGFKYKKGAGNPYENLKVTDDLFKGPADYGVDYDGQIAKGRLDFVKNLGKELDDAKFDPNWIGPEHLRFHGSPNGRSVVEVAVPGNTHQTQLFYKSSGLAGKSGSGVKGTTQGLWQPYGGHATLLDQQGPVPGWFIKDAGYKDYYNSKSFKDIAGRLDDLTKEAGFDLSGQAGKYQDGGEQGIQVPKRNGVRKNSDGSESTHLMATETLDGKNWFSFPTLFQNEDSTWLDMSDKPWMDAYKEATKRGEVIEFGTDKEKAIKFGEGSWKPKAQRGFEIAQDARMRNDIQIGQNSVADMGADLWKAITSGADTVTDYYTELKELADANPITKQIFNTIDPVTKISDALDILSVPGSLIAEIVEGVGGQGDSQFNITDAIPNMSGDFSFTNINNEPVKNVADVVGVKNPVGAFALNLFTDPSTYVGAGLAKNVIKKGIRTGANSIDNAIKSAYKYNPVAYNNIDSKLPEILQFNRENNSWLRQVGKPAIQDVQQTGVVRELNEVINPKLFDEKLQALQNQQPGIGFSLDKRYNGPYFQKGELFFDYNKKPIAKYEGKTGTRGRSGSSDYLIETKSSITDDLFQPAYRQVMYLDPLQKAKDIGDIGIMKPLSREADNFNFYKKDWWKGYKQTPLEELQKGGSTSLPIAQNGNGEYKVESGDTFYGIANKNKIPWNALKEANPNLDYENLKLGQQLTLPNRIDRSPPMPKTGVSKNSNVLDFSALSDYLVDTRGGTTDTWGQLADTIAYHESSPWSRMDPKAKQYQGGPGRGLFQFEGESFNTALKRYKNVADAKGFTIKDSIVNAKSADELSSEDQYALFLANLIESKTKLSDFVDGNISSLDVWLTGHKNVEADGDRASFLESKTAAEKEGIKNGYKTFQEGGKIDNNTIYKNYINGVYEGSKMQSKAEKVYDKLNRLHYRDAKAKQMTPANYVLTYITG